MDNNGPERALRNLLASVPVFSPFHITLENNENFLAKPVKQKLFWRAIGGAVRQMRTSLQYPYPTAVSGSEKVAPLGVSGGTGQLVVVSVLEMAFRRKVVVHRGMD